jgi:hypothetical protein
VSDTRPSYETVLRGDEVSDTFSGDFPLAVVQIHSSTEEARPHATAFSAE